MIRQFRATSPPTDLAVSGSRILFVDSLDRIPDQLYLLDLHSF